jgi:dolichol-phosphate mannosyltransferase
LFEKCGGLYLIYVIAMDANEEPYPVEGSAILPEQPESAAACIIAPTYNESKNISAFLDAVFKSPAGRDGSTQLQVLVVDDNSPDGTSGIVKDYQKKDPRVHLLVREKKEGLGRAYIAGMKYALENLKPDIVLEMDADLSHNPMYLEAMLAEIRGGKDFVIGSRYVAGGSVPDDWGIRRKLISRMANAYAKTVLGIGEVEDCTGGFRAIRSTVFDKVDLDSLDVKGYAFQISLLYRVLRNNFAMKEVPIAFSDRKLGKSKMRLMDMIELAYAVLLLRINDAGTRQQAAGTASSMEKEQST